MTADERTAKLWWAVPAATVLILIALASLFGKPPGQPREGTSYDASSKGFRAAFLLLEELNYPVERSKRAAGGAARLVLFPNTSENKAEALDAWVRDGGIAVLAVENDELARHLGMPLKFHKLDEDPGEEKASGAGVEHLAGGAVSVECSRPAGDVWVRMKGKPAVTIYQHGKGEIWLLNRPELFTNAHLKQSANAVLLCRLATAVLQKRSGKLAFDEYFHGMNERPGVTELLLQPPAFWITLQSLLLLGLLLWRNVPRFGTLRSVGKPRRRSKDEFLDAMAALLERKGDYADALATAREDLTRELEQELGLPAGTSAEEILREAERRHLIRFEAVRRVITAGKLSPGAGKLAFVRALNELENAREEFFNGRHHR